MKKKRMKTSLELMKEVRHEWLINPVTRVHDDDPRKKIKKMRSEARKTVKKALSEESKGLFSFRSFDAMRQKLYLMKASCNEVFFLRVVCMILILLFVATPYQSNAAAQQSGDKLIDLSKISSDFVVDLHYATANNFTGIKLYPESIACLQESTAWKLAAANQELQKEGCRIKIWDAYRPLSIQKKMWSIMPDPGFLADPYKNGSNHNRGAAVDVTLVDRNGKELEMPSGFDEFTSRASRNSKMSATAAKNLKLLTDAMTKNGFKTISTEWWHFDDTAHASFPLLDVSPKAVSQRKLPIEELSLTGDAQQAILVTAASTSTSQATLTAYEKKNGKWVKALPDMKAYIGKNGFKKVKNAPLSQQDKKTYKYEGDGSSPMGIFTITTLFGWGTNPGFKIAYKPVTADDYWVSGSKKELYNVWINRKNGPDKSWTVFERLKVSSYRYAAVIDYNNGPDRVVGNGSAIFLHIAGSKTSTSGCTALSEANLTSVLKWLDPVKKPVIIQGTMAELKKMGPLAVK